MMIHVGTTPVCLKHQEKNSRVHTLGLGVLVSTGATTNILVSGAHRQRLYLKRSGGAQQHWGRTPVCRKGRAWCAGNQCCCRHRGYVMASGAGAAGPAQDVHHPPPGYPDLLP